MLVCGLDPEAAPASAAQTAGDLLTVEHELLDGAVVLRLSGEIDMATGP